MFRKLFYTCCAFVLVSVMPVPALAAAPQNFKQVVDLFLKYIKLLVPLVIGITFVMLVWGLVRTWIFSAGNSEKIGEGQQIALWGVIGLAVAFGVWGLVALLRTSLFGNI